MSSRRVSAVLLLCALVCLSARAALGQVIESKKVLKLPFFTFSKEMGFDTVTDRRTISDDTRTVELMHVPNPHANGYLAIYRAGVFTCHK